MRPLWACALVVFATTGCDKLKTMAGKGSGDAAAPSSATGTGLLGSIFDPSFEGEITAEVSSKSDKSGPKSLVFGVKSPKIRVDLGNVAGATDIPALAQGGAFIIDPPAKKGYMLVPAKKMAMVIDFDKAKQARTLNLPGGSKPSGAPPDPPKIEKTGKKQTIAGYTCEEWKVTNKDGSRVEACMAEGIKWIDLTDLGMQSPELAAAAAIGDLNHFPLKLVAYDAASAETSRIEAKKIDKKKLADAQFTVPADYQQLDMSQLMSGLSGMASGMPPGARPPMPRMQPPKR